MIKIPKSKSTKLTEEEQNKIKELCEKIEDEIPFVDVKPYSHNIIGFCLLRISEIAGKKYANRLIDEFNLKSLGWSKESEEE